MPASLRRCNANSAEAVFRHNTSLNVQDADHSLTTRKLSKGISLFLILFSSALYIQGEPFYFPFIQASTSLDFSQSSRYTCLPYLFGIIQVRSHFAESYNRTLGRERERAVSGWKLRALHVKPLLAPSSSCVK